MEATYTLTNRSTISPSLYKWLSVISGIGIVGLAVYSGAHFASLPADDATWYRALFPIAFGLVGIYYLLEGLLMIVQPKTFSPQVSIANGVLVIRKHALGKRLTYKLSEVEDVDVVSTHLNLKVNGAWETITSRLEAKDANALKRTILEVS